MSDNDEFGAFLVGFIVGGVAGAVAALLLAPQSGEETRAIIKERSIELRDKATVEAEEAWKLPKWRPLKPATALMSLPSK